VSGSPALHTSRPTGISADISPFPYKPAILRRVIPTPEPRLLFPNYSHKSGTIQQLTVVSGRASAEQARSKRGASAEQARSCIPLGNPNYSRLLSGVILTPANQDYSRLLPLSNIARLSRERKHMFALCERKHVCAPRSANICLRFGSANMFACLRSLNIFKSAGGACPTCLRSGSHNTQLLRILYFPEEDTCRDFVFSGVGVFRKWVLFRSTHFRKVPRSEKYLQSVSGEYGSQPKCRQL